MRAKNCEPGIRVRIWSEDHPFFGRVGEIAEVRGPLALLSIDDFAGGGTTCTVPCEFHEIGFECVIEALAELADE